MLHRGGTVNRLAFARAGAFCIPATGKTSKTGEDGFYIANTGKSIGVADGVGGWAEQGVDPSIFTRRFMKFAAEEAERITSSTRQQQQTDQDNRRYTSSTIMHAAFDEILKEKLLGSCAALFVSLENEAPPSSSSMDSSSNNNNSGATDENTSSDEASSLANKAFSLFKKKGDADKRKQRNADLPRGPFGVLNVACVGDCGVAVIRAGMGLVYTSREQTRSFNFPFQLGHESDTPTSALVSDFCVAAGDIVILGSDGLFDNVFPEMLPTLVRNEWRKALPKHLNPRTTKVGASDLPPINCEALAEAIAKIAYQSSKDADHLSPFALRARMVGVAFEGGKVDDITVIVAQVLEVNDNKENVTATSQQQQQPVNVEGGDNTINSNEIIAAGESDKSAMKGGPFTMHLPSYRLIEDFFQSMPISRLTSKL